MSAPEIMPNAMDGLRSCACCNYSSTHPPFETDAAGNYVTWCGACGRKGETCGSKTKCKGDKWRARKA